MIYKITKKVYTENQNIYTHYEGTLEELLIWLKPYLNGHRPRTYNGLMKVLREEHNDKYSSKIRFIG